MGHHLLISYWKRACLLLVLCWAFFGHHLSCAQDASGETALARLQSREVSKIQAAIDSLTVEEMSQPQVAAQLTLLLNDQRRIPGSLLDQETVSRRAWYRMLDLPTSAAATIVDNLSLLAEDSLRGQALEIVALIGKENRDIYVQILPYCQQKDPSLRSRALAALSAVGGDNLEFVQEVGRYLQDNEPVVRREALDALDTEGRQEHCSIFLPQIISMLDDDSEVSVTIADQVSKPEKLRGRVARFLAKIGPPAKDAVPKLRILTDREQEPNVRIWAAAAICKIETPLPPEYLKLIGDLMLESTGEAPEAIVVLGPLALPLLDHLEQAKKHESSIIRGGLADAFFAVDRASAVERTLSLTRDEEAFVKATVIQAYGDRKIDEPVVIEAYIRALGDHDNWLYEPAASAVRAVIQVGAAAKSAVPALEKLLKDPELPDPMRRDVETALSAYRDAGGRE